MTETAQPQTVLVTGAAGFIGSHLTDRLLENGLTVVGTDNLSRGTRSNLSDALSHPRFQFLEADLSNLATIREILSQFPIDTVWHMVANSDIGAGVVDPSVDFRDTFLTTFHLLLAMREAQIRRIAFPSTSAVYGVHSDVLTENTGPLFPISSYGAMKLASEGIISAAVESHLERAWIFRFPNVVGPRATHGIIFDLLNRLKSDPPELEVFGDGTQQKPYLHVSELVEAMLIIHDRTRDPLNYFMIGPDDEGTTVRNIAEAVIRVAAPSTAIHFTGGSRGWVGDVPKFRYSIEKLKRLGWSPRLTSLEAIEQAIPEIYSELFLHPVTR